MRNRSWPAGVAHARSAECGLADARHRRSWPIKLIPDSIPTPLASYPPPAYRSGHPARPSRWRIQDRGIIIGDDQDAGADSLALTDSPAPEPYRTISTALDVEDLHAHRPRARPVRPCVVPGSGHAQRTSGHRGLRSLRSSHGASERRTFHPGPDQQSIIRWTSPYSRRSRSMCCSRPPITVPHRCRSIMTEPSCSRQAFLEWATPSSSPELPSLSRGIRWIERSPRSPSTSIPFWSTRRCRGVRPFRSRRRLGEGVRLCSGRAETSE